MKTTRHIEITRYSRRVTVSQGSDETADPAAELLAIDLAAGEWEVIPPGDGQANAGRLRTVEPAALQISQRRPRFSLRQWLTPREIAQPAAVSALSEGDNSSETDREEEL